MKVLSSSVVGSRSRSVNTACQITLSTTRDASPRFDPDSPSQPDGPPGRSSDNPASGDPPTAGDTCSDVAEVTDTLDAFPGVEGHGSKTVGGSGRHLLHPCTQIFRITSLKDSGDGTLRKCIEAKGPRTCIFDVGGLIWSTRELRITNPYITIAGQTAPQPGIAIRGAGLSIETSEVIVQNIRFRIGDDPRADCCKTNSCSASAAPYCTADPGSRDGVRVRATRGNISNIIIDHVSISWALDEGLSLVPDGGDISNVTISNTIIGSGLDMSIHPEASNPADPGHSKAVLISGAHAVSNVSFIKNLLAHNADRNIRIASPVHLEYINNIVYDWGRGRGSGRTIELSNSVNALHQIDLIANYYKPGPDTFCPETQYRPELCFENGSDGIDTPDERRKMHALIRVGSGPSSGLSLASRYFLFDNFGPTRLASESDDWTAADRSFFLNVASLSLLYPSNRASAPVAASNHVTILPIENLMREISINTGAYIHGRDIVDVGIVRDLNDGTGRIVNCVSDDGTERCRKNAGGWPGYPQASKTNILGTNPFADSDGDGYTNLEESIFVLTLPAQQRVACVE